MAPKLKTHLRVETWANGVGTKMMSHCESNFTTMNIGYIDFDKALKTDGMEFKTTKGTWFRFLQAREKGIRYVSV